MKKIALIPAYEPDEKLINLVNELIDNKYEIIVVNDGSNKNFNYIFDEIKNKVHLISYKVNKGKGYALKKGINYIKDNYKEYICITIDSDGQHKVSDANKLYEYNLNNLNTLVLGKRIINKDVPLRSKIGNSITRLIFKLITKNDIYDTQTGLRSFSNKLEDYMLNINGDRYEYEMNVLLNLKSKNVKVKEIEIKTIYFDNNKKSHFNTIKDSYKIYSQILRFTMSSIISFLIDYSLFIILNIITNKLILSNIISRLISSICNYNFNKKLVFKSNKKLNGLISYFLLVITILSLNTLLLGLFVSIFNFNKYISKIIVELILFIISYLVQKNIIFKKEDDNN